jgi:SAM-dependent methyltransferase
MEIDEYLKLAGVEDQMWYFLALHGHIERALVRAGDNRPAAILDAGCGTGGLIRRLAPRHPAWRWTGIDLEPVACELARNRAGDVAKILHGSVTALPFPDAQFDAVVSADVLYHVDDDAAALREFFRVLRPGGVVVMNVPAYRWLWSYHDTAVHSRRRYGRGEVLEKLRAAGFGRARATFWNTLPFPLVVARRKLLPAPASGSDVKLYAPPIEAVFNGAMALERTWLRTGMRLPFGSSVFAVASKAPAEPFSRNT